MFVFLCSYRKKHPVKLLFQSIFIMVILKKSTECTKTTFKNVYKYTFKRVWFKYVAISKQSVSFTKPRLGPAFASYFSNLLLQTFYPHTKENDSEVFAKEGGGVPITRIIIPHLFIYKAHFARTTIALHSKHKRCSQVTQSVLNHVSPALIPSLFIWKQNFRRHELR